MKAALRLLTRDKPEALISAHNTAAWYAKESTVRAAEYFVCVQPGSREPFFIGKVSGVVPVPESGLNRWALMFREYAHVDRPDIEIRSGGKPERSQNPVFRFELDEALRVPLASLEWKTVGERSRRWSFSEPGSFSKEPQSGAADSLTISEAKRLLAESHGVRPEQVEITIRA
jgi:hypothetical protein